MLRAGLTYTSGSHIAANRCCSVYCRPSLKYTSRAGPAAGSGMMGRKGLPKADAHPAAWAAWMCIKNSRGRASNIVGTGPGYNCIARISLKRMPQFLVVSSISDTD